MVPGEVKATLEIRDLAMEVIDDVFADVQEAAQRIGRNAGVEIGFERFYTSLAAPTHPELQGLLSGVAQEHGFSHQLMPSGAGHDAQSMAELGPIGMVFVPSQDGVSHSPLEFTDPADIARGTNVLLNAVVRADRWEGV